MQPVPPEVWANFERRLDAMRVPPPQRPDYRKWVRFYFDFCHKYGHSTGAVASRGPFLAKLASKNQSVAQLSQASAAIELLAESAPEPGATRPLLTAGPTGNPRPPLNSRPPVLSGCGERGLRAGGQVPPVPHPNHRRPPHRRGRHCRHGKNCLSPHAPGTKTGLRPRYPMPPCLAHRRPHHRGQDAALPGSRNTASSRRRSSCATTRPEPWRPTASGLPGFRASSAAGLQRALEPKRCAASSLIWRCASMWRLPPRTRRSTPPVLLPTRPPP